MNIRPSTVLLVSAWLLSQAVNAEVPDPDPGRFTASIETFMTWDSKNSFPSEAILFVGSSSVKFWPTAVAFRDKPVINRGFGGAELSDVVHFYESVIKKYAPRKIFLYAGDNDIENGKTADQVFEDYKELVGLLRADLPDSELVFISIKPSRKRWEKWPMMVEANQLVRGYAASREKLAYADLATPLLDNEGALKDVFLEDDLHLNEEGYRLWGEALAPFLD
jgi:lysophospholipase L1-like esterase